MVIGIAISVMLFASMTYLKTRADQVFKSSDRMDFRIVLDGIYAYTVNGIKQSWCFTSTWGQDLGTCNLNNPLNTARLLLSDETLTYIASTDMPRPTNINDSRLKSMSVTIDIDTLMESHPLYSIFHPVNKAYSKATITIARDDSLIATTKGREVPLTVQIVLTPDVESDRYPKLQLKSNVIVYPRELTYFGLILPRDLYMNTSNPASTSGNNAFAAVTVAPTAGLRFESPIFVNGNFYLPSKNSAPMSNVVFVDKVVIGGGLIYQDGNPFAPIDAGGSQSMYNSDLPTFKGLLAGFELDGSKDEGLDYLFKINSEVPPALSNMDLCLSRIRAAYDLSETKDSQLYSKLNSSSGNNFNVSVNIGRVDNLVEQFAKSGSSLFEVVTNVPGVTKGSTVKSWSGGAVLKARMVYEGLGNPSSPGTRGVYLNEFYLPRNGEINLFPIGSGSGSPEINIKAKAHTVGANDQNNQVDLTVSFVNPNALDIGDYKPAGSTVSTAGSMKLIIEAMDYGYNYTDNIREDAMTNPALGKYKTNGFVFYKPNASSVGIYAANNAWNLSTMLKSDSVIDTLVPAGIQGPPVEEDLVALDKLCMKVPGSTDSFYASFPSASWSTSFVKQSLHAWSFSSDAGFDKGYSAIPKIFDSNNAGANPVFKIQSLLESCQIKASATLVTGFYVCNNLTIEARSAPLRIIGTFATKSISIDPSAYKAGIRWSSIYHPQAAYELRNVKILGIRKDNTQIDCENLPPLWMANIGVETAVNHYLCNPVSLRTADPFKWTTVDPDCGVVGNEPKVSCKKQATRFMIKEITRARGL
jgi:hypothetical protein